MPKNNYIVGFDIGTRKVVAVIGEVTEERKVEIIGIGTADSHGLRKGVVVDLDATTSAIKKAQRGGRAHGRRRDRLGLLRHLRGPHQELQQPAASSPSRARTARSPARTSAASSTSPRPSPSRPTGTSSTSSPRSSSSTTRTASRTRPA
ncbi:MAG: hypothetical protein MZU95_06875 [Desulfomicrobium escambiense]|nr:hypothetical protein [Desulfomicrobium escambiense]